MDYSILPTVSAREEQYDNPSYYSSIHFIILYHLISFFFITFIAYTPPLSFLQTFIIIPSHFTPYTLFHSLLLQPLLPPQNHSDSLHSHLISTPTDLATSSTLYQLYNTTFHTLFSITLFPIYKFQLYHPMQISIVSSYN